MSYSGFGYSGRLRRNKVYEIPENATEQVRAFYEQHNELAKKRQEKLAERRAVRKAARAAEKEANKDVLASVKVGDVFDCSWGYEQTNVDFFQVVEKVGDSSVRLKQVQPLLLRDDPSGPMAADRTYDIPNDGTLLPATKHSVFIKDQERGDVKRILVSDYHAEKKPYFRLSSFAFAFPAKPGLQTHYESWYA